MDFNFWINNTTILGMLIKGIIIGVVISAPMGPVGILTVQRTLNKDRWCGFFTGVGATTSDFIYALLTGYCMSFVSSIFNNNTVAFWVKIVGSILLFFFGFFTYRSNPIDRVKPETHDKGTLFHNFISGFFITLSNPLIILLFMAMYGQMTFILPSDKFLLQMIGYIAFIGGCIGWWFLLTHLVDKVRNKFNVKGIWLINRIIGVIVMVVSTMIIFNTIRDFANL